MHIEVYLNLNLPFLNQIKYMGLRGVGDIKCLENGLDTDTYIDYRSNNFKTSQTPKYHAGEKRAK